MTEFNKFPMLFLDLSAGSVAALKELMKFNQEAVRAARIKKNGNTAIHLGEQWFG